MATTIEFVDLQKLQKEESEKLISTLNSRVETARKVLVVGFFLHVLFSLYVALFTDDPLYMKWIMVGGLVIVFIMYRLVGVLK